MGGAGLRPARGRAAHPHPYPSPQGGGALLAPRDDPLRLGEQGRIDRRARGGGIFVDLARAGEAPTMAEATFGSRSTQASANWARLRPASAASGFSLLRPPRAPARASRRSIQPPISSLVARLPAGGGASGLYLPVSTPWPSGDQTICEMPLAAQSGITSSSGLAPEQASIAAGWRRSARRPPSRSRPRSCRRRHSREADIARLAALDRAGQRLHRLLERRVASS